MLKYEELERYAKLKRLSINNAEKDYLIEAILFVLYSHITDELVFKGGTCLFKFYNLDRFSEDIDLTQNKKVALKKIFDKVISDLELIDINGKIKEITEFSEGTNVRLLLKGPLYRGKKEELCFIPINIISREKLVLEPIKKAVFPIYKELNRYDLFVMQEKEILAEKIRAILTRNKARDIYDAWHLLQKEYEFDLGLINKKLSIHKREFNLKEFNKSLDEKKGLWQTDLKNLLFSDLPDFNNIKKDILNKVKTK